MDIHLSIGERIMVIRNRMHLTQAQLARRIGHKAPSHISKIETGCINPTWEMICRIASALEVDPIDLLPDAIV